MPTERNMAKVKNQQKEMLTYEEAVKVTPDVSTGYRKGVEAFGEYKSKIKVPDSKKINGSLDIDAMTVELYPETNRWDYAICYDSEVFYIEIHPACTSEVSKMLKKLNWLKSWLVTKAPAIDKLTTKTKQPYYWIQSSNCKIPTHMPQYKQIVQYKIRPIAIWDYNIICKQAK